MVPFNVQPKGGSFLQKELSFINFPNGHPASFNIQTIKLFSFEAHHVITLVNFSLLQLLSVLTLSDPHLSIILHVIREILYIPFIFANSCIFFSSFAVSFCNRIAIYFCWVAQQRYWHCGYREKCFKWQGTFEWRIILMSGQFISTCCHAIMPFISTLLYNCNLAGGDK